LRVVGYVRKSTDRQEDSLDTQESLIQAWVGKNGHELLRIYREEPMSGFTPMVKRAVFPALLTELMDRRREFGGLVVVHTDRLFRNVEEHCAFLEILRRHKCELFSINNPVDLDSPMGKAMSQVFAVFAEFYRADIGVKVRDHNLNLAMGGRWPCGQTGLGYEYDTETGEVRISDRGQDAIRVFEAFVESNGNARQTAQRLNRADIRTLNGNLFTMDGVLTLIRSATYRRKIRYGGKDYDASALIPELIPESLLAMTDTVLAAVSRMSSRAKQTLHAYSGFLQCSKCGANMSLVGRRDHPAWWCSVRKVHVMCDSRGWSNRKIDKLVGGALQEGLSIHRDAILSEQVEDTSAAHTDRERERLTERRARVLDLYEFGRIDRTECHKRLDEIEKQLAELSHENRIITVTADDCREWLDLLSDNWQDTPVEIKRGILLAINARITVETSGKPLAITLDSLLTNTPIKLS
jgi:DNA invertase Pin-like site-specific DNA recombinase